MNVSLDVSTTKVFNKGVVLKRMIEDTLGGTMMSGVHVLAHQSFIDAMTTHAVFEESYKYQSANFTRGDNRRGFQWTDGVTIACPRFQERNSPDSTLALVATCAWPGARVKATARPALSAITQTLVP